jgi:perosamine synthetase
MKTINEAVVQSVLRVLQDGHLFRYDCNGPQDSPAAQLELAMAGLIGTRHAVAMNSCSSALYVALLAAGVRRSDRVLVPAFTFTAVPSAVVHAGAQPVLVEVTPDYVLDCDDLEARITEDCRFLLLSYMRGRVPDLDRILSICQKHSITLIEDCAHSLGVLWNGVPTGRFGKVAAFSAQSYKIVDAGEGGLLVTDDDEIALKSLVYAGAYETNWKKHFGEWNHARCAELVATLPAFNLRMSNLSAAAILPQLSAVEQRVQRYNALYWQMARILEQSTHIRLPKFLPPVRPAADSVQFELIGFSPDEVDAFVRLSDGAGVPVSVLGRDPFNARCFWHWRYFERQEECPRTRQLLMNTADMRIKLGWSDEDAERVAQALVTAAHRASRSRQQSGYVSVASNVADHELVTS